MTAHETKTRHDDTATRSTLATRHGAEMPRPWARQFSACRALVAPLCNIRAAATPRRGSCCYKTAGRQKGRRGAPLRPSGRPLANQHYDDTATRPTLATRYGAEMPRLKARQFSACRALLAPLCNIRAAATPRRGSCWCDTAGRQKGRRGAPLRPSGRPWVCQHPQRTRGYAARHVWRLRAIGKPLARKRHTKPTPHHHKLIFKTQPPMNYTIIIPDKGQIIHCRNYRSAVNLVNELRCGIIIRNDNPLRDAMERDIRRQWSDRKEVANV